MSLSNPITWTSPNGATNQITLTSTNHALTGTYSYNGTQEVTGTVSSTSLTVQGLDGYSQYSFQLHF